MAGTDIMPDKGPTSVRPAIYRRVGLEVPIWHQKFSPQCQADPKYTEEEPT